MTISSIDNNVYFSYVVSNQNCIVSTRHTGEGRYPESQDDYCAIDFALQFSNSTNHSMSNQLDEKR